MKIVSLIIKVILLVFFVILALINTQKIPFFYVPGQQIEWPLIVVLFISLIIGAVLGIFSMFGRLLRLRAENNRLRAEVQKSARLNSQDISAPAGQTPVQSKTEPKQPEKTAAPTLDKPAETAAANQTGQAKA